MLNIIPHWPPSTWIIIGLTVTILVILESTHRKLTELEPSLAKIEIQGFSSGPHGPVGIDIHNPSEHDLTDIEIELLGLGEQGEQYKSTEKISDWGTAFGVEADNRLFKTWASGDGSVIKALSKQAIYLAKVEEDSFKLLLANRARKLNTTSFGDVQSPDSATSERILSHFGLLIEIRGKLEGRISSQIYKVRISYEIKRHDQSRQVQIREVRKI